MRGIVALALGGLLAGCGALPEWPVGAQARAWTVPLVMAWRPSRLLIEVRIDGAAPMLMALDTTRETGSLRPDVVDRLRLRRTGDPTRGARVEAGRVAFGDIELRGVQFTVESAAHGTLFGRPVVGLLGTDWFAGRRLEHDPTAGVLRVVPLDAPPRAEAEVGVRADDGGWRVPIELAGVSLEPLLATNADGSALGPDQARAVVEAAADGRPSGAALIGGMQAADGPWQVVEGAGDGLLSPTGLHGLGWRLDTRAERLGVWRALPGPARFGRFGPLPDCGPGFSACISGRIHAVAAGRVELVFERPERTLPERFWLRVDLGPKGRPYWALVQLGRRPPKAPGALTAVLEDARLGPARIRPVGAAVDVVDVVPGDRPCGGVVCLDRQEGDAAELIMESSAPTAEGSPDGVAPPAVRAPSTVDPAVP